MSVNPNKPVSLPSLFFCEHFRLQGSFSAPPESGITGKPLNIANERHIYKIRFNYWFRSHRHRAGMRIRLLRLSIGQKPPGRRN